MQDGLRLRPATETPRVVRPWAGPRMRFNAGDAVKRCRAGAEREGRAQSEDLKRGGFCLPCLGRFLAQAAEGSPARS